NLPVISGFHTRFDTYSRYYGASLLSPLIARYLRAFHNATTSTLVPDAGLARQLRAQGYRSVETLGRGVDTQRFRPELRSPEMRAGWGATEEAPVLLYVGRIAVEKNLKLAIEAFRSIRAAHPGARFVLVGDGPLRAELQRHHPELIFPGIRRGEELARYYASADVFLFPSLSETFGNVTLEALASGLPVVAFDDAAAGQHVLDTVNGRIAPYGDTDRWIEAALGTALLPAETLQRWRLAARQSVRSLGWQQIARRFGGILASAAALPPSSATEEAPLCSKP
ncbi:MAG: glycosyltransferase, partial [Halorhodospira sp.]